MPEFRHFAAESRDGVYVLTLCGDRFDMQAANEIADELTAFCEEQRPERILFNLGQVTELTSAFVGKLLINAKKMGATGVEVDYCAAPERFHGVFVVLGRVHPLQNVTKSEAEVLAIMLGQATATNDDDVSRGN